MAPCKAIRSNKSVVEISQRTELCLEVESRGDDHADIRRRVTNICVTQLGLTNQDAERLLNCQGPFLVSAAGGENQLKSIISDLKALGVLVRPSDESLGPRQLGKSCALSSGRTALYSSQYGELLGARLSRHHRGHISSGTAPSRRTHSHHVPLLLVGLLTALTLSSMVERATPLRPLQWANREAEQSSAIPLSTVETGLTAVLYRGSTSRRDKSMTFQVVKSGNNYSARFAGEFSSGDSISNRVEGEPFFLQGSEGELSATTPVTVQDKNGTLISGSARVRITLSSNGEPRKAHVLIALRAGAGAQDERDPSTFATSFDLLP